MDPKHVYFAPHLVNRGTNGCAGGTYCLHRNSCLYPGARSFGTACAGEGQDERE